MRQLSRLPRSAARLAREASVCILRRAAPQPHWPVDPAGCWTIPSVFGGRDRRRRRTPSGTPPQARDAGSDGCPARLPASASGPLPAKAGQHRRRLTSGRRGRRYTAVHRCPQEGAGHGRPGDCWRTLQTSLPAAAWHPQTKTVRLLGSAPGANTNCAAQISRAARNACWTCRNGFLSAPPERSRRLLARRLKPDLRGSSSTNLAEHRFETSPEAKRGAW